MHLFDEIIDVRTPAEFGEDRIPGAVNLPALADSQRHIVGALYKNDPFAARKRGAEMLAENLAAHLRSALREKPPQWKPLVYCWRGGQRSGAVVEVLRRIGWPAEQLCGGYKSYRKAVAAGIADCAGKTRWVILAGKTGAGKTALLATLAQKQAAALDLEALANHRGSAFGELGEQPSQRRFESLLWRAMKLLPAGAPVFVESEGRKIGKLHTPAPLLAALRSSPRAVLLSATLAARAENIRGEYAAHIADDAMFAAAVAKITPHAGAKRAAQWRKMHNEGEIGKLLADLLQNFYDIGYEKSLRANYPAAAAAETATVAVTPANKESLTRAAETILRLFS